MTREAVMEKQSNTVEGETVETTERALATREPMVIMPAMSINQAVERYGAMTDFVGKILREGIDFGVIPGTGTKPTLLKPGAEKLTTFFGLIVRFETLEKVLDWTGENHGGEPFFYYEHKCKLYRQDQLVGEGMGSCNSWEKKYRWRVASITCPDCGQAAVIKGKAEYGGGWICWAKKGGCGNKWEDGDPAIEKQERGIIPNENPADLVNTISKMSQKRSLVSATLITVNASEFFTQDIEDMVQSPAPPPPPPVKFKLPEGLEWLADVEPCHDVDTMDWEAFKAAAIKQFGHNDSAQTSEILTKHLGDNWGKDYTKTQLWELLNSLKTDDSKDESPF